MSGTEAIIQFVLIALPWAILTLINLRRSR
jgi:hypothetical protein